MSKAKRKDFFNPFNRSGKRSAVKAPQRAASFRRIPDSFFSQRGYTVRKPKKFLNQRQVVDLYLSALSFAESKRIKARPQMKLINGRAAVILGSIILFTGCNWTGRMGREAHFIGEELPPITEKELKEAGIGPLDFEASLEISLRRDKEELGEMSPKIKKAFELFYEKITGEKPRTIPRLTHNFPTWVFSLFAEKKSFQIGSPITGTHIFLNEKHFASLHNIFHEWGHSAHINSHWGYLFSEELRKISEAAADFFAKESIGYIRDELSRLAVENERKAKGLETEPKEKIIELKREKSFFSLPSKNIELFEIAFQKRKYGQESFMPLMDWKDGLLGAFESYGKAFNFLNQAEIVDFKSLLEAVKATDKIKSQEKKEFLIAFLESEFKKRSE